MVIRISMSDYRGWEEGLISSQWRHLNVETPKLRYPRAFFQRLKQEPQKGKFSGILGYLSKVQVWNYCREGQIYRCHVWRTFKDSVLHSLFDIQSWEKCNNTAIRARGKVICRTVTRWIGSKSTHRLGCRVQKLWWPNDHPNNSQNPWHVKVDDHIHPFVLFTSWTGKTRNRRQLKSSF